MSFKGIRSRFRSIVPDDSPALSEESATERASFSEKNAADTTSGQTNQVINQDAASARESTEQRSRSTSLRRKVLDQPTASPRSHRSTRQRFLGRDKRLCERSMSLDRSVCPGSVPCSSDENIDVIASNEDAEEMMKQNATESPSRLPHHRIAAWARDLMDDMQSIDDACRGPNNKDDDPGDSLAVKRLKNNIARFGRAMGAISSFCDWVQSLRQWESPTISILLILAMLYAIWHGVFLTLVLGAILWRLTLNYLASRGWSRRFGWTCPEEEQADESDKASSVAERVASIVQIARKVQNHLGAVCDAAEKVKSLLLWRHEASSRLYLFIWTAFLLTLFVPAAILFRFVGAYLVFKLMVLDYIYFRFPRLREKYDTSPLMWDNLPTDAEWAAKCKQESQNYPTEARSFRDSFNLPASENPLPGCQNGFKSSLINRDKSLTSSFKTGRLFITQNYICFERSKTHPEKNIMIPLEKIERIEKSTQSSWIPGGGMLIEVIVEGYDRAFSFGAFTNRDEVYEAVRSSAEKFGRILGNENSKL